MIATVTDTAAAPAQALHEAGDDEFALRLRKAAGQRGKHEQDDPGDEHPPATDEVTKTTPEQQEAAERDQVAIDHPRQARLREVQVALNMGQRNVDDRGIEDAHQLSQTDDNECYPASAGTGVTIPGCHGDDPCTWIISGQMRIN